MSSDLTWRPALELAAMLRSRRLSSEDLTLTCLERIDAVNPRGHQRVRPLLRLLHQTERAVTPPTS